MSVSNLYPFTYFLQKNRLSCKCGHAFPFLGIFVSNFGIDIEERNKTDPTHSHINVMRVHLAHVALNSSFIPLRDNGGGGGGA